MELELAKVWTLFYSQEAALERRRAELQELTLVIEGRYREPVDGRALGPDAVAELDDLTADEFEARTGRQPSVT